MEGHNGRQHGRKPGRPPRTPEQQAVVDRQWFECELVGKLEALIEMWEDLGALVGTGPGIDYDAQQGGLLALSVMAREAAVCISTRPPSARLGV
jgi:hypothetical protein